MDKKRKTVFISYSWDNPEHQKWVLKLASDLIARYGIIVILDQYELSAGKDLTYFMESSIEKADKILVILTPNYKTKAENRTNGVGYETSMISQEVFESPVTNIKVIPILRLGNSLDSSPKFLRSKLYHSMLDDSQYDFQLLNLAKSIHDTELIKMPPLGDVPDFESIDIDPIIDIANKLEKEERLNLEIDAIIKSDKGLKVALEDLKKLKEILNEKIILYQDKSSLQFGFEINRDNLIINMSGYSVSFNWSNHFGNSAINFMLLVKYWKGHLVSNSFNSFYLPNEAPTTVKQIEYRFDLDYDKKPIWKKSNENMTIEDLSQSAFVFLIEQIQHEKTRSFRGK
jgi:hypothetical protein